MRRLLRFLRLWPVPPTPIGCLTNTEIDALAELERATGLVELYGNALEAVAIALREDTRGGVQRARTIIAGLDTRLGGDDG